MEPSCYLGPLVLIEGGCFKYRNLACDAGPGGGNNDHGDDYHYIFDDNNNGKYQLTKTSLHSRMIVATCPTLVNALDN